MSQVHLWYCTSYNFSRDRRALERCGLTSRFIGARRFPTRTFVFVARVMCVYVCVRMFLCVCVSNVQRKYFAFVAPLLYPLHAFNSFAFFFFYLHALLNLRVCLRLIARYRLIGTSVKWQVCFSHWHDNEVPGMVPNTHSPSGGKVRDHHRQQ